MISTQISVPSQPGGWRGQERTGCWEMERSQLCDQKWWNFVVTAVYKAVHGWSPFTREDSKCGELMWNICRAGWSVFTFCSALRSAEMRPPASQDSPCNSYLASQLSSRTGLTNIYCKVSVDVRAGSIMNYCLTLRQQISHHKNAPTELTHWYCQADWITLLWRRKSNNFTVVLWRRIFRVNFTTDICRNYRSKSCVYRARGSKSNIYWEVYSQQNELRFTGRAQGTRRWPPFQ